MFALLNLINFRSWLHKLTEQFPVCIMSPNYSGSFSGQNVSLKQQLSFLQNANSAMDCKTLSPADIQPCSGSWEKKINSLKNWPRNYQNYLSTCKNECLLFSNSSTVSTGTKLDDFSHQPVPKGFLFCREQPSGLFLYDWVPQGAMRAGGRKGGAQLLLQTQVQKVCCGPWTGNEQLVQGICR